MKSLFDKLNLRPQERRLVVIVLLVIFVLLNMWFVWPYFGDWSRIEGEIQRNRATLDKYQREIGNRAKYEARQRELETTGSEMLASETDLQRIIEAQAAGANVQLGSRTPLRGQGVKTNQFFQEGGLSISFSAGGKEVVDFLVGIAAQNTMVRVRDMTLRPDPTQTKLAGTMIFIGNFQTRPSTNQPARSVAAAAPQTKK
jgi:Tfp pilus assembly protein PilO